MTASIPEHDVGDYVDEAHCSLCSGMWPSEREAFRENLEWIPVNKPVCNRCLMTFWRNLGFPVRDDPIEH
jgi:hypothetical protein